VKMARPARKRGRKRNTFPGNEQAATKLRDGTSEAGMLPRELTSLNPLLILASLQAETRPTAAESQCCPASPGEANSTWQLPTRVSFTRFLFLPFFDERDPFYDFPMASSRFLPSLVLIGLFMIAQLFPFPAIVRSTHPRPG
jgi:hypothetical protein